LFYVNLVKFFMIIFSEEKLENHLKVHMESNKVEYKCKKCLAILHVSNMETLINESWNMTQGFGTK